MAKAEKPTVEKADKTKVKKTFKELNRFSEMFKNIANRKEKFMETKFGYACKRFEDVSLVPIYREFNTEMGNARIDHALVDKNTEAVLIGMPPRGFQYSKEGLKNVIKEENRIDKEWADREFEVTPYICKKENLPKDLTPEEEEVFTGLVI